MIFTIEMYWNMFLTIKKTLENDFYYNFDRILFLQ